MNHKVGTAIMSFFTFVPKLLNILNMNWIFSSLYLYLYWNLYRPVIWLWDLFRKLWIVIGIKILNLVARVYDVKWSQRPCLPYDYSWIWSHFVPHMPPKSSTFLRRALLMSIINLFHILININQNLLFYPISRETKHWRSNNG